MDLDALLADLEPRPYEPVEDWTARLLSATYPVNQQLDKALDQDEDEEERRSRLEKWLKRLFETVREASDRYEAAGFSISVGIPAGVAVSVDWKTSSG